MFTCPIFLSVCGGDVVCTVSGRAGGAGLQARQVEGVKGAPPSFIKLGDVGTCVGINL